MPSFPGPRAWLQAAALLLAGCHPAPSEPPHAPEPRAAGPARCAANRAAGPITFLTSAVFLPTTGILDVVAAQRLGYFDALCLDVRIRPGGSNAQLVSAGTAQIAGLGDAASALLAMDRGANLTGIATYGNISAVELVALRDAPEGSAPIRQLADLKGRIVGYKVAVAPQVIAMLIRAGVSPDAVKFVSVPFNPEILAKGQVAAMIGYASNEPRALEAGGYALSEWNPERFGVHSTFNVLVANRDFAAAHPQAVADFLRASLRALAWVRASDAHLDTALGFERDRSPAGFDLARARARWRYEEQMIAASQPAGSVPGENVPAGWQADARLLADARLTHGPAPARPFDNRFIQAIYKGTQLLWPAP
ncbi:MAG TPA: ABC transporter substrate-binding protein [Novosphingobium sp.]|nr:ABC transporter substrate-binding protein [Novosphingobium sp.]